MFVRPIIEKPKVHFKISELFVIIFGTGCERHAVQVLEMAVADLLCIINITVLSKS